MYLFISYTRGVQLDEVRELHFWGSLGNKPRIDETQYFVLFWVAFCFFFCLSSYCCLVSVYCESPLCTEHSACCARKHPNFYCRSVIRLSDRACHRCCQCRCAVAGCVWCGSHVSCHWFLFLYHKFYILAHCILFGICLRLRYCNLYVTTQQRTRNVLVQKT